MTLSFMALLVIPDLKIGDRGLFDVRKFAQVPCHGVALPNRLVKFQGVYHTQTIVIFE